MSWGLTLVVIVIAVTLLAMTVVVAAGRQRRRARALLMHQRFLAALCHELRTPLNAMAGSVSLLRSSSGEARQQAMSVMERNLRIEAALIEELLDASELLAGTVAPRYGLVDLTQVVTAATNRMLLPAQHKGVTLTVPPASTKVFVSGDRRHIGQAVGHLVSHAIRCVRPGGTLSIETVEKGETVELRFSAGPVETARAWSTVVDPFRRRLPDALCDERALGLSIVREVITLHGGALRTVPSTGGGAVWVLSLPSRTSPAAEAGDARSRVA